MIRKDYLYRLILLLYVLAFLLNLNLNQVRENQLTSVDGDDSEIGSRGHNGRRPEEMILTGLTALATARSMQTRRLASARDDPNVSKILRLSQLLREILLQVTTVAGEKFMPL